MNNYEIRSKLLHEYYRIRAEHESRGEKPGWGTVERIRDFAAALLLHDEFFPPEPAQAVNVDVAKANEAALTVVRETRNLLADLRHDLLDKQCELQDIEQSILGEQK